MAGGVDLAVVSEQLVLDASAWIDLARTARSGSAVHERIGGCVLHAPAHVDAEVLAGLGRLHRSGDIPAETVAAHVRATATAPVIRHDLAPLLAGAWGRRERLRLADALYVELAERLGIPLITTDVRLGRAVSLAEVVEVSS